MIDPSEAAFPQIYHKHILLWQTLKYLAENLKRDMKLADNQLEVMYGGMSDKELQRIVDEFGRAESPIRVIVASDVASEGINLHYLSHRLIHFDIPWSLMVFQQRNGRIDRYGQHEQPVILYIERSLMV